MGSAFGGLHLFDSGPHRFVIRGTGRFWFPAYVIDELQESTEVAATPLELSIVQTGRLVAGTDAALWALVDAIRAEADAATKATLVDHDGRFWQNMTLLRFEAGDRVDRGRVRSLGYSVRYIRLNNDAPAAP